MRECVTHHYACDCREEKFKEIKDQLKEALSIIEELRESNEFYADRETWTPIPNIQWLEMVVTHLDEELIPLGESESVYSGGKLARKTKQSTDQRIEKLKKEVV